MSDFKKRPLGYRELTVGAAAVALSTAADPADGTKTGVPKGSFLVCIECETSDVRWRDDGTDPTATQGSPIYSGNGLVYEGQLAAIKFIRDTAALADATLRLSFYAL